MNLYALLLDSICISFITLFFYLKDTLFRLILTALIIIILGYSFRLHESFKRKYRVYQRLLKGNKKRFRPHTFHNYMNAPCTRQIVLQVLEDINRKKEYNDLKKKYQTSFWTPKVSHTRIVLYKRGDIEKVYESDYIDQK